MSYFGKTVDPNTNFNATAAKRISTITSSATPTPDYNQDAFTITALAVPALFSAPTGTTTLTELQELIIRIKDNGTPRVLTWDSIYRASSDLSLPITTILGKTLYMYFQYNAIDNKWDLISLLNNF